MRGSRGRRSISPSNRSRSTCRMRCDSRRRRVASAAGGHCPGSLPRRRVIAQGGKGAAGFRRSLLAAWGCWSCASANARPTTAFRSRSTRSCSSGGSVVAVPAHGHAAVGTGRDSRRHEPAEANGQVAARRRRLRQDRGGRAAMLATRANGLQAAIMAPTEILAEQHLQGLEACSMPDCRIGIAAGAVAHRFDARPIGARSSRRRAPARSTS